MHLQFSKQEPPRSLDDLAWGSFQYNPAGGYTWTYSCSWGSTAHPYHSNSLPPIYPPLSLSIYFLYTVQLTTFDIYDPRLPSLLPSEAYLRSSDSGKLTGVAQLDPDTRYQVWCCVMPRGQGPKGWSLDYDDDEEEEEEGEGDDETASFVDSDLEEFGLFATRRFASQLDDNQNNQPPLKPPSTTSSTTSQNNSIPVLGKLTATILQSTTSNPFGQPIWHETYRAPWQSVTAASDARNSNPSTFFRIPVELGSGVLLDGVERERERCESPSSSSSSCTSNEEEQRKPALETAQSRLNLLSQLSHSPSSPPQQQRDRSLSTCSSTSTSTLSSTPIKRVLQLLFQPHGGAETPLLQVKIGSFTGEGNRRDSITSLRKRKMEGEVEVGAGEVLGLEERARGMGFDERGG